MKRRLLVVYLLVLPTISQAQEYRVQLKAGYGIPFVDPNYDEVKGLLYSVGVGYNGKIHGFQITFGGTQPTMFNHYDGKTYEKHGKRLQFGWHYSLKYVDKPKYLGFLQFGFLLGKEFKKNVYFNGTNWISQAYYAIQATLEFNYRLGNFEPGLGVDTDLISATTIYSDVLTFFPYVGLRYNLGS